MRQGAAAESSVLRHRALPQAVPTSSVREHSFVTRTVASVTLRTTRRRWPSSIST